MFETAIYRERRKRPAIALKYSGGCRILYSDSTGAMPFHMPNELDSETADSLVMTAVSTLSQVPGEKILCARRALKGAILAAAQEAYSIGFMAGQESRLREGALPGSADRPAWMDIRLDDQAAMTTHHLRLRPIVLRSLLEAEYQCLGDLRWVPLQKLIRLFYVGRKTAKQIRAVVERLEREGESWSIGTGGFA
jgi:hypothetical protein